MTNKASSITYYDENAEQFVKNTLKVNMLSLYQEFLPLLPVGGHILDAGCGSGRDSLNFIQQGYKVTAFDGSKSLVDIAAQLIGQPVQYSLFQDFQAEEQYSLEGKTQAEFDGIWACASLLHVASDQLPQIFQKLATMLKKQGKFYCSFKYGVDDYEQEGRYFTNADEARLKQFISSSPLQIEKTWLTADLRPNRENESWLNAILSHTL